MCDEFNRKRRNACHWMAIFSERLFLIISQALRERNWKAVEALAHYEKMASNALDAQCKLESKDNEIKTLNAEIAKFRKLNHVSQ